jgi:cell division protein FtsW
MLFTPIAAAGVVYAILTSEYRVKRILAFIDPYADPQGIGYHTIQSLVAVAGGEGFGRGLGHGLQKFGYLPEDRTDFLFAIICEELGIAGAGLVITLFLTLLFAGITIAARERSPMLRLFTLGVIATVCLQAIINLAVVTGLAPTKGIALPLLSSGGTGWILTAFSLGLLIAIDRGNAGYAALESGSVDDLNLAPAASSVTPSPEARATQPADVPSAA